MGIGFKSVFQRFRYAGVRGFGWSFRFAIEVETGAEFGDQQPDLIGAVLPVWDDSIPHPDAGFTTRFEFRGLLDPETPLVHDIEQAVPSGDQTVLALLAEQGVRELRTGLACWDLHVQDDGSSLLVTARGSESESRWRLFPVEYIPSRSAVARLLERRRIRPGHAEKSRVYAEAARSRRVIGVMPVDEDDIPQPPASGTAYALLPTASALPFALHIHADWLVNISRRGLPELGDNEWQNEIVQHSADVLAIYLRWLAARHQDSEALRLGFSVLEVPAGENQGTITRRIASAEWRRRLAAQLENEEILPGYETGAVRLRRPTETAMVPKPLESITANPDLHPALLFSGPVVAADILGTTATEFFRWLGILQALTPENMRLRWQDGLGGWWSIFEDEAVKRRALFSVWAGLSRLAANDPAWNDLRIVPTVSGRWTSPPKVEFLTEVPPTPQESRGSEVAAFLAPHSPPDDTRPVAGLIEAMRSGVGGADAAPRRIARDWFEGLADAWTLEQVVKAAVAAQLKAEVPPSAAFVHLAQWALSRNRADLIQYLIVGGGDPHPPTEALLAEPFVEHGESRRRIWPHTAVVVPDYVESDPESRDAHEWRVFFERMDVLGPVRLTAREDHASRYDRARVAEFLGVKVQNVGESNNAGYTLVDFVLEIPLGDVDANAIAGWLEEGHAALRGKERHRARYQYNSPYNVRGERLASWVELLSSLPWVPCTDGSLRCPPDVLMAFDPARDEAPVAQLSDGLAATLQGAGVEFGARIPEAPVLRQLQKKGSAYNLAELAAALEEAIRHIESHPDQREQFSAVVQDIQYPNPRGDLVPFDRLVQAEGPGSRSGLGGWVSPVGGLPERLRRVLLDARFPLPIPARTTGSQSLAFLQDVWRRAAEDERHLAQDVGDYLPFAYSYVLDDASGDEQLSADWNAARAFARVFTSRRRWLPVRADPAPLFADVEASLLRRFLPDDYEIATSGHLGATPHDQQRVANALRLDGLSSILSIVPRYGRPDAKPNWERRFHDLLAILGAARRSTDRPVPRIDIHPVDQLIIEVNGVPQPVGSYLEDFRLYVSGSPRYFALDAVNYVVDAYGLSQQARMAALLAMLLGALDEPPFFAEALGRFATEFAPEFDITAVSSITEVERATPPPGKIQKGGGDIDEVEAAQKEAEALRQAG